MSMGDGQGGWRIKCYKQHPSALTVAGAVLVAIGLLLLFLCIPGWAWAALSGVVLVGVGCLLIRLGRAGR